MSSLIILSAPQIRAELAYRAIPRKQLASELGISYSYLIKILNGHRIATAQRELITDYFKQITPINDIRGIS